MNKKLFFFALICILTSTLLVSCRNLTQSAVQEFSFSIDAATAAKIAEKAPASLARASSIPDTDTRSVSIALKLTSVTPGVFLCTDSTTTTMNRLVGTTLTIDNVPLNVQLKASLECFVDGVKVYTAESDSSFTLVDETPYALSLTLREVKPTGPEYSTPYVVWKDVEIELEGETYTARQYYRMANGSDTNPVQVIPLEWEEEGNSISSYCFDSNGNLWFNFGMVDNLANGSFCVLLADSMEPTVLCQSIGAIMSYDPVTDRIFSVFSMEPSSSYLFSLNPQDLLDRITEDTEETQAVMMEFLSSSLKEIEDPDVSTIWYFTDSMYAYDGILYALYEDEAGYYEAGHYLYIFSGDDGSLINSRFLSSIPGEEVPEGKTQGEWVYMTDEVLEDSKNYYFANDYEESPSDFIHQEYNDIAVIDDTIYVLYNENVFEYDNYSSDSDYNHHWYIDRGGVLKFNAQTLVYEGALGLNSVKDTFTAPVNFLVGETYSTRAYLNNQFVPLTLKVSLIWSLPSLDNAQSEKVFSCPSRFVAIKPKKLVIADGGTFYYTSEWDEDTYSEEPDAVGVNGFKTETKTKQRFVTVDLEDFSKSDFSSFEDRFCKGTPSYGSSWKQKLWPSEGEVTSVYAHWANGDVNSCGFNFISFVNTYSYYNGDTKFTYDNEDYDMKTGFEAMLSFGEPIN